LFQPDNLLAPRSPIFIEAWHAQVLAIADTMVRAGHISSVQWASELGRALRAAEDSGAPDTEESYYLAVLTAIERLCIDEVGISVSALAEKKHDWEEAYHRTPHGKPVLLQTSK
jgi:hypothetical protein